jgi:lycopene beta-cyclase
MADSMHPDDRFDAVLVGGGLQNALIALALLEARPESRIALVERGARLCGEHTWSFHERDVPDDCRAWLAPLIVSRWADYDVKFPAHERTLKSTYASITSERVAGIVEERLRNARGSVLLTGAAATQVDAHTVVLEDGTDLAGHLVIDARGPELCSRAGAPGYQKFLGLELELGRPSPFVRPLLMDARVPQVDGYRFVYVLPFSEHRVLVEDTYFSDSPSLDVGTLRERVHEYARGAGLDVQGVIREETGVLPLPVKGLPEIAARSPLAAGYAGGWFHPGTGYSFPVALRLARHVAQTPPADVFGERFTALMAAHRKQFRFAAFLNRMLFAAFAPEMRFSVLERFYKLPEDTIARFYALDTTAGDRLRILCGRPPRGMSFRFGASSVVGGRGGVTA